MFHEFYYFFIYIFISLKMYVVLFLRFLDSMFKVDWFCVVHFVPKYLRCHRHWINRKCSLHAVKLSSTGSCILFFVPIVVIYCSLHHRNEANILIVNNCHCQFLVYSGIKYQKAACGGMYLCEISDSLKVMRRSITNLIKAYYITH